MRKERDMSGNEFHFWECLLYLWPIVNIFIIERYFKNYLKFSSNWPLSLGLVLIPLWLVLIYSFGYLIFQLNILPIIILLTAFSVGVYLSETIRNYRQFFWKDHYLKITEIIFMLLSVHLFSLLLLRWWVFFF